MAVIIRHRFVYKWQLFFNRFIGKPYIIPISYMYGYNKCNKPD